MAGDSRPCVPRLLVIMGSGETSPTMVKTHRQVLERLGPPPVPAVVLDTPFGFQENAAELAARAVEYFRASVGREIGVASFRSAACASPVEYETMLARLRQARYVFAGPGSPSYALRQWRGTRVPDLLADKLCSGGAVVFASAAACTLGCLTIPVYEIYKVGEEVRWLEGLDLLGIAGLPAAVVPHFDNAEGGSHDTRYCYMGERRLRMLEDQMPEEAFVLGVDEHTACVIDLVAETVTVVGRGAITVRRRGHGVEFPAGSTVTLRLLRQAAHADGGAEAGNPADGGEVASAGTVEDALPSAPARQAGASSPLLEEVASAEAAFDVALEAGDARGAAAAILDLDATLVAWAHETFSSDEPDRARDALRSMIVRLADRAAVGLRDPREVVGPFIDLVLRARQELRDSRQWAAADALRDRLVSLGLEVHDTPEGAVWTFKG